MKKTKASAYLIFFLLFFIGNAYCQNYTNGRLVGSEKAQPNNGLSKIISYAPEGTDCQVLVAEGTNILPSVSWDGNNIIFSKVMTNGSVELFEMDMNGSNLKQITFNTNGGNIKAVYSPDGTKIAFMGLRHNESGHFEVWIMDRDGSNMTQLTNTVQHPNQQIVHGIPHVSSGHPSFTPDGQTLYYSSTGSGDVQIWKMNIDGTNKQKLTSSLGTDYPQCNVPMASLDGIKITHWSGFEGNYGEIWTMNPDGSNHIRYTTTDDPENSDDPVFSPDRKKIVYGRSTNGNRAMYVLDIASGQSELVASDIQYFYWQPLPISLSNDNPNKYYELASYPNPFSTSTTIKLKSEGKFKYMLTLFNSSGQLIRRIENITTNQIIIERNNLRSGVYFFKLQNDTEVVEIRKLVIK